MASNPKIKCRDMRGKVAVVTGGSRGIGRECCLALARAGCHVAVLAKSTTDTPNLPGTIFTVAKECEDAGKAHGVQAIGVKCDLRDVENCAAAIETVAAKWGRCAPVSLFLCFPLVCLCTASFAASHRRCAFRFRYPVLSSSFCARAAQKEVLLQRELRRAPPHTQQHA